MPVTCCVFADLHYFPGAFSHDSREWLDRILDHASQANADFIVHLGDLTHNTVKFKDFVDYYNAFRIPTHHVIGNHDNDGVPFERTLERYGLESGHYHFDCGGFRFIVLDPNYYLHDGQYIHYSASNYYAHGPERDWIPPEQLAWLEETVEGSPFPCVLLSHESLERPDGVRNQDAARAIIDRANERHPGRVRLCLNGHHHQDHLRILERVVYFEVNSANFYWLQQEHDCYPADVNRRWEYANHTLIYTEPLHAIITLTEDGGIRIQGMKGGFLHGVTSAQSGNEPDCGGRPITPVVQSADLVVR